MILAWQEATAVLLRLLRREVDGLLLLKAPVYIYRMYIYIYIYIYIYMYIYICIYV